MHLRIHICPVCLETDLVVLPALRMKADRVVLVTEKASFGPEMTAPALDAITKQFDKAGIAWEARECDPCDFHDCLRAVGAAVRQATAAGDHALVNLSAGARLPSHAAAVAGMMWGAELYCATPGRGSCGGVGTEDGQVEFVAVPRFDIEPPPEGAVACLRALASTGGRMPKQALIGALVKEGLMTRTASNRKTIYSALETRLRPLFARGWIEERGRSRALMVHITDAGRGVLCGFDDRDAPR